MIPSELLTEGDRVWVAARVYLAAMDALASERILIGEARYQTFAALARAEADLRSALKMSATAGPLMAELNALIEERDNLASHRDHLRDVSDARILSLLEERENLASQLLSLTEERDRLRDQLEEKILDVIEARNPGINREEVKASRAGRSTRNKTEP